MICKFCIGKEMVADDQGDLICIDCPYNYARFVVPENITAYGKECWSFQTGNKIVFSSDKNATVYSFDTDVIALAKWNYYRARAWADIKAPILPCVIKASCDKQQIEKCGKRLERWTE